MPSNRKGSPRNQTASPNTTARSSNGNTPVTDAPAVKHTLKAAKRGWFVTPIKRKKNAPRLNDWQDSNNSCEEAQIRAWAKEKWVAGFAVVTGDKSGIVVLDLDPRNHTDESKMLLSRLDLPKTMVVETPGGGTHHYFEMPIVGGIRKQELAPGIELLGNGGSAALPGSEREDGTYKLRRGPSSTTRVAPLPDPVLSAAVSLSDGSNGASPTVGGYYREGVRNNALASLAGKLRRDGISEAERVATLQIINKELCKPPLEEGDVHDIARGMNRYDDDSVAVEDEKRRIRNRERAREELAREAARPVELPQPGATAKDYLEVDEGEPLYTIKEWHPKGSNTLVVAQHTAGKTTLGINLKKSLADNVPFLGKYAVDFPRPGRVAYLDYEMVSVMFKSWVRAIKIENLDRVVEPAHLKGKTNPLLHPELFIEWLIVNNVKVLILDPAIRASDPMVNNENDSVQANRWTGLLDRVKLEAGVEDLFLLHHMGAGAQFAPEGKERGRGSSRLPDWADNIWTLTKEEGARSMWAEGRGVDIPPDDAVNLQFNKETHELTTNATRASKREDTAATKALDALVKWGVQKDTPIEECPTTTELKGAIPGKDSQQAVFAAEKRGWIDREKVGKAMRCVLTEQGYRVGVERRVDRP